jgi:multicomponent K+:H+ antiporter subunit D
MSVWLDHLVVAPIVLPLATGALMLLLNERRYGLKAALGVASMAILLVACVALLQLTDSPTLQVYRVGDWPAPFGIVLVADRLSAMMVLLTAVLGFAALLFSLAHWHRAGPRFLPLLQFLIMGVNGAFLTGDVFNLFVFFEVLLAASYGLALYGSGRQRVREGMHYIVINLTASLLFLIGATLLYAVTGTLNFADLAARAPQVAAGDRVLFEAGAAVLGIAFLVKAGMWPLCFWLPGTYGVTNAPSAAVFAILTKVGTYAVLRTWLLLFGTASGESAGFGATWLLAGGMATLGFGVIGLLASQDTTRMAGYSLLISSGTILAAVAVGEPGVIAAALFYLVASTLGVSAFFLLIELVERGRRPGASLLAITAEAFGEPEDDDTAREDVGVAIPATMAILGFSFACCALSMAGLPPLPAFVAKFALFDALLGADPIPATAWLMLVLLLFAGLSAVISVGRAGINIFWAEDGRIAPRVRIIEIVPVMLLLGLSAALTVEAEAAMRFFTSAAEAVHAPGGYIEAVLGRR